MPRESGAGTVTEWQQSQRPKGLPPVGALDITPGEALSSYPDFLPWPRRDGVFQQSPKAAPFGSVPQFAPVR